MRSLHAVITRFFFGPLLDRIALAERATAEARAERDALREDLALHDAAADHVAREIGAAVLRATQGCQVCADAVRREVRAIRRSPAPVGDA